jgi:hypothetical protein
MIKTQNDRARLIGKEDVRRVLWDTTVAGLDPDGGIPTPVGTGIRDYCLGSDVEEAQLEIGARLREQLVDEISERIAQKIPHLRALELLEIRRAYLEALTTLLER